VDDEVADHESARLVVALQQAHDDREHVQEARLAVVVSVRPREELSDVFTHDER